MDRTQETDDETDEALRASGDDSSSASENGDELRDDAPPRLEAHSVQNEDPEEEDDDDGDDSDAETQRIGTSVLRFARRCVKTGEFAKAMAALLNVVEISELRATPCRQALLFAAQVFMVTSQETRALECVLELWDNMPAPYTRQDGQLLLAVLYERLEQPRFAQYWFSKAFTNVAAPSASATLSAWLSLAERSYEGSDMILSTEAYSRAFGCIFQAQRWPAGLLVFQFVSRFLTALVSVAHLRRDRRAYRQQIAFSLAVTLLESDAIDCIPLGERAFDSDYVALRRVYATSFPTVYEYLFSDEDRFVGRIARAWRVWRARRARKRAIEERERQKREALLAAKAARAANAKKKKPKPKPRQASPTRSDDERDSERLRLQLRLRTKARVESLRSASPAKTKTTSKTESPPKPAGEHEHLAETVASPTRRKLETVKRLRGATISATNAEQVQEANGDKTTSTSPSGNQRPASSEASLSSPSRAASLLDVYAFPPLASRRLAFEADAGRPPGPADLDDELQEIEEFARLAHYRSRVLVQRHQPIEHAARLERVAPQWLRRFQDVAAFVEAHDRHFSEIHARVVRQLGRLHAQYVLQHGKTRFTIRLAATLRRLENWQCTNIAQELRALERVGEREEAHRNLEVFHALQHAQTTETATR